MYNALLGRENAVAPAFRVGCFLLLQTGMVQMRVSLSQLPIAFTLVCLIGSARIVAEDRGTETISVKAFGLKNVIGHLGHPLGTVVRVTGTCVEVDRWCMKMDSGQTLLRVEFVDGKKLDRPYVFRFSRAAIGIAKPSPGDKFDYYVHEWGAFDGHVTIPDGLGINERIVANDGFHYRPQITIHKSNTQAEPLTATPK
jgi:hypothetical protein